MNIQHSMRSDSWMSPLEIVQAARNVLGDIDLDPASDLEANVAVRAKKIYTRADDGLSQPWGGRMFINPPGGKRGNKSVSALFWQKLMSERIWLGHAIFLAFSAEALQNTQGKNCSAMMDFPFCVPAKRLRFISRGVDKKVSPSHSNVVVYVPGSVDRSDDFEREFSKFGKVKR